MFKQLLFHDFESMLLQKLEKLVTFIISILMTMSRRIGNSAIWICQTLSLILKEWPLLNNLKINKILY